MLGRIPVLSFLLAMVLVSASRDLGLLPGAVRILPEMLGAAGGVLACLAIARARAFQMYRRYLLVLALLLLTIAAGAAWNGIDPGVLLSGLRNYLKYVPFFIMAWLATDLERDIARDLKIFLAVAVIQVPIAAFQALVLRLEYDRVTGLLAVSSALSLFQVAVFVFILASYFAERVSLKTMVICGLVILIPAALNETKGTLILLPLAIVVVTFCSGVISRSPIRVLHVGVLAGAFVVFFDLSYTLMYGDKVGDSGVAGFFLEQDKLETYLYSGDDLTGDVEAYLEKSRGPLVLPERTLSVNPDRVRRLDAILVPMQVYRNDPLRLLFGLGVGNASTSVVDPFSGPYRDLGGMNESYTALSIILWELGFLGLACFIAFFCLVAWDAMRLASAGGLLGVLGSAWCGISVIAIASLPYKNLLDFMALAVAYWYLSGVVVLAAARMRFSRGVASSRSGSVTRGDHREGVRGGVPRRV